MERWNISTKKDLNHSEIPYGAETQNIAKCFDFIFEFSQWISYIHLEGFHKELVRNSEVFYHAIVSWGGGGVGS